MQLKDLTSDDWIKLGLTSNHLKKGTSVQYIEGVRSGHSQTGYINFKVKDGTNSLLFVKQFYHPQDSSPAYVLQHDINSLLMREVRNCTRIFHNVGPYVPKLVGYSFNEMILSFEYVKGYSDKERLIKALGDESKRLKLIYEGVRKVACFDGKVQSRQQFFEMDMTEKRNTSAMQVEKLVDYLLKIVQYHYNLEGKDVPDDLERFKDYIRLKENVNLVEEVVTIVKKGEIFTQRSKVLQHGDCRTHHVIGDKLVDLEQFGLHPHGYDLVTYLNAEGKIALPNVSEFPDLLGWFLACEKKSADTSYKKKDLEKLDEESWKKLVHEVDMKDRLEFMVQFLSMHLVENLHLDASNKRYSPEHLASFIQGIPNYSVEKMMVSRLQHIGEIFELVADNSLLIGHLPQSAVVNDYFSRFAELLQRLHLVDMPETVLGKLKS